MDLSESNKGGDKKGKGNSKIPDFERGSSLEPEKGFSAKKPGDGKDGKESGKESDKITDFTRPPTLKRMASSAPENEPLAKKTEDSKAGKESGEGSSSTRHYNFANYFNERHPEPEKGRLTSKIALEDYFSKLNDIFESNKKNSSTSGLNAIREGITNDGIKKTHNEWVIKPAQELFKVDPSSVGDMNEALQPTLNTYKSRLRDLNNTEDGKAAEAFRQLPGAPEETDAVKRYEKQKLDLDVNQISESAKEAKDFKYKRIDKIKEKYKAYIFDRIKSEGFDHVYDEKEEEVKIDNPEREKEGEVKKLFKMHRDIYKKNIDHLNNTEDGKAAEAFRQRLDAPEETDAVKRYEKQKLDLEAEHIMNFLFFSELTLKK